MLFACPTHFERRDSCPQCRASGQFFEGEAAAMIGSKYGSHAMPTCDIRTSLRRSLQLAPRELSPMPPRTRRRGSFDFYGIQVTGDCHTYCARYPGNCGRKSPEWVLRHHSAALRSTRGPRARLAVSHPRGAVHDCLSRPEEQAARSAQPAASALSPASMSAKARVPIMA